MRIVVPIKQTPDLVEELELNDDGTDVDREFLKFVLSEWDDQALEEALLVKEAGGGEIIVVGFGDPDVELSLYTALAKGADRAVNLTGLGEGWIDSHTRAAALTSWLSGQEVDLVLAGVQAVDDLDGQLPPPNSWLTWMLPCFASTPMTTPTCGQPSIAASSGGS
jgi:electron transfer flavoprotein beta subunit